MNSEAKNEIYRIYYDYGKPDAKGKHATAYKLVTAASHSEARANAIKTGPGEGRQVVKWKNVVKYDSDQIIKKP